MTWQFAIVGVIVFSALVLTVYRLVQFFTAPPSRCHGCSGCKLTELKTDMAKKT